MREGRRARNGEGERKVWEGTTRTNSVFALRSGERYELVIRPSTPLARVRLRDIQGVLHVRSDWQDKNDGAWHFAIDVLSRDLFRRPETLFYDVETDGHALGEIPLSLQAGSTRKWKVAATLGAALTLQGAVAAVRKLFVTDEDDIVRVISEFNASRDYNVFFLASIPVAWGVLCAVDWLQYRVRY